MTRQKIVQPSDIPNEVFRIGDVSLRIPPSGLEIQKNDLTYQYRTLRTKASSKIPTGSGQVSIHLSIPFLNDHLLSMHRLITEIRNSPFVWVENRFVRESIVPEWPYTQQMAFTITGLSISNMPNATDAWVMELDATWFSYFPYGHNFLFREDWITNYLRTNEPTGGLQALTIGWNLGGDYNREYFPNVVSTIDATNDHAAVDHWSVVQNRFLDTEHERTIYEIHQQHPGVEHDLLPLPGNMQPANIVQNPINSRIFVRYHNFLQRDALKKNFNIDVDTDVQLYPGLWEKLFSVGKNRDNLDVVIPLDSLLVPAGLRQKWITRMLESNSGVRFMYHVLKEIRLPQKWLDHIGNKQNQVVKDLFGRVSAVQHLTEIQRGSSEGSDLTIPVLGAPFRIGDLFGNRIHPTEKIEKPHEGVDIPAPRGTPVVLPENARVVKVVKWTDRKSANGNYITVKTTEGAQWSFRHLDTLVVDVGEEVLPAGTLIGTVGNTGRTTAIQPNGTRDETKGYHLHLAYVPPGGSKYEDPLPTLRRLQDERVNTVYAAATYYGDGTPVYPTASGEDPGQTFFDYNSIPAPNTPLLTDADQILQLARAQAQEDLKLTDDEATALTELMQLLDSEGWAYYDDDTTVSNVWKKLFSLKVNNSGLDYATGRADLPEEFRQSGIILTSISGSLSHIVAQIPILGQEYPTHQHLGSTEPEYQLEFAILDDQTELDGLSAMGQLIQGMRSELQSNARRFRPVLDGWCMSTDTFLTRLLGTYQENDFRRLEQDGLIADVQLRKRFIIAASYSGTVQGNPGLSTISFNIQETNPYMQENLISSSSGLEDKEAARSKVLQAIYNLDVAPKYRDLLAPLFLASKLGTNFTNPKAPDFGKFSIPTLNYLDKGEDLFFYSEHGEQSKLILRSSNSQDLKYLQQFGLAPEYFGNDQGFIAVNPQTLDSSLVSTTEFPTPVYFSGGGDRPLADGTSSANYYYLGTRSYDVSSLIQQNPALSQLPIQGLLDNQVAISSFLQTGSRMFTEQEEGGLERNFIVDQLYGLPARQDMWQTWQLFLLEWVKGHYSSTADTAIQELTTNPAWPRPGKARWVEDLPSEVRQEFATYLANDYSKYIGEYGNTLWDFSYYASGIPKGINAAMAPLFSNINIGDIQKEAHKTAISRLVVAYLNSLPIQVRLPMQIKEKYQYYIGETIGNLSDNKAPALDYMSRYFNENAESCGNITYADSFGVSDNPTWVSPGAGDHTTTKGGLLGNLLYSPAGVLADSYGFQTPDFNVSELIRYSPPGRLANAFGVNLADYVYPTLEVHKAPGSPFVYSANRGYEEEKVKYIKTLLSALADDVLGNYRMLQLLGLEYLHFSDFNKDYVGLQCYPDLDLPAHPYYGTTAEVYPDFYMWNIYEDGGALGADQLAAIQEQVNFVVENCHASMTQMSNKTDISRVEQQTLEPGIENYRTQITPEGREGMDTPFAPSSAAKAETAAWLKLLQVGGSAQRTISKDGTKSIDFGPSQADINNITRLASTKPSEYMADDQGRPIPPRMSNTEGYGGGGGVHYPRRLSKNNYDLLKTEFAATSQMFGSSEGYMNRELNKENAPDVHAESQGTNIERVPETAHNFDLDSLKALARDSSKDLISQKMSMKRAYPTFKLYFVEEDEFETRFLNFDDFYSYNAIKEITVVQSRKLAADHAIIKLQNISGTLDGTRRNSISDLDYFSGSATANDAKKKLDSHEDTSSSVISGDPITSGTSSEQPFGSVVLRPGLNVQLRLGFSNDPENLQVMLSGRVVDVTWNTTGDLAEIMVQSFGVELEQVFKGTHRDANSRTYATTHELLGSMMLEPEVQHFGRWEFGQSFQTGESKDHKLDFTEYSRDGQFGKLTVSSWIWQWIMNHPKLILAAGVAGTAVSLLPFGRAFGALGKLAGEAPLVGKFLKGAMVAKLAVAGERGAIGYSGYVVGLEGLEGAAKVAAVEEAKKRLITLGAQTAKGLGARAATFTNILATKTDEAMDAFYAATDVAGQAAALAKLESFIQFTAFKGQWMYRPWVEMTAGVAEFISATGFKPIGTFLKLATGLNFKVAGAVVGSGLLVDAMISLIYRPIYQHTLGAVGKFFARTSARMFLTPQDDNLYPPHPKDYMTLDQGIIKQGVENALGATSMFLFNSTEPGATAYAFFYPDRIISKKVNPDDCKYQLVSTTIWKVFHEMSLRHPGWIYGTRPYGGKFQYTMFFGLPAQRYWARPETNGFITRANDLYRFLSNDQYDEFGDGEYNRISEFEFKTLYGEAEYKKLVDRAYGMPLPLDLTYDPAVLSPGVRAPGELSPGRRGSANAMSAQVDLAIRSNIAVQYIRNQMTAMAMQEYLRAVQIRFEPFRRYHLLTSDRDIVWNGIMGSDNAVANAVDVTYFPSLASSTEEDSEEIRTAVFKANSFIPESKLRIAPVRWQNCIGYGMAQRYAMGELCDRMRDMYRGEIIILGNPRVRPWDIGILVDSFNSMVGPIEVEQVVHTYSHETGYITEIKPSAVLFANEISGWPMIEAMKLFGMAVQDIHGRFAGVKADNGSTNADPESLSYAAKILAALPGLGGLTGGDKRFDAAMAGRYQKLFGDQGPGLGDIWGGEPPPNFEALDGYISSAYEDLQAVATVAGFAGGAITLAGAVNVVKTGVASGGLSLTNFRKGPAALAFGGALLTGLAIGAEFGAPLILNQIDFPGLAFMMGGSVLFLQCLRNDAIILVPITKSGIPIVSGLAYNDPSMIWKSFRGQLNNYFQDTLNGTANMVDLYKRYGSEIWTQMKDLDIGASAEAAAKSEIPFQGLLGNDFGTSWNDSIIDGLTGERR